MKYQFYRFYILLLLAAALLVWSFHEIYESIEPNNADYPLQAEQLFSHHLKNNQTGITDNNLFEEIESDSIHFPEALNEMLKNNQIIAFQQQQQIYYYKQLDENKLLRIGPLELSIEETNTEIYYVLIFYSCLAVLMLFLMKPVFSDLGKLQKKAIAFGENPLSFDNPVSKNSSIYPLSKTFSRMSNQLVDFIHMHKDLARTISHEIRTPLSRMKFLVEKVSKHLTTAQYNRITDDIDEIEGLLHDYLSFSKLEHNEFLSTSELSSVSNFMETLEFQYQLQEELVSIRFHQSADEAYFEHTALLRAAQNIINNALRYCDKEVNISFFIKAEKCYFIVEDDGCGFKQSDADPSAPFVRIGADHNQNTGYGLGLYIVRKVMIWHRGEVIFENSKTTGGAIVSLVWSNHLH